jgi:hypothetical protein
MDKKPTTAKQLKDYVTKHTHFNNSVNGVEIVLNLEGVTTSNCVARGTMTCAKAKSYLKEWALEKVTKHFGGAQSMPKYEVQYTIVRASR